MGGTQGKPRWITWQGEQWRLTTLAVTYGLRPQTLAGRLDRGYPIARALATGICSRSEAGLRGALASRWREE